MSTSSEPTTTPWSTGERLPRQVLPDSPPVIVDLAHGDRDTVAAVFAGLSAQSRYRRFQSARATLPPAVLDRLAAVRPGQHVAHVALLGGRPVGLVRWIRWRDPMSAEIAYEVADAVQRRGLGRALLRRAARSAAAAGVQHFLAQLGPGDEGLHRRIRELGGRPHPTETGLYRLPVAALVAPGSG